jgi:hypothetical protein
MILSVLEYAEKFPCKGKTLSRQAIIVRCIKGLLPSDHHARQLPCESKGKGQWVIEVPDEVIEQKKIEPVLGSSINSKHFSW